MSVLHWPETLPQSPATNPEFAPMSVAATFDADVGEPISRPRTTGAPFILEAQWAMTDGQIATFEAFFANTLGQGTQRFAWREVISGEVRMWRFTGPYQRRFPIKTFARIATSMMMLPGVPWFAPYARAGLSTVPAFVADYENAVFGIDGKRTPASSMPTVEGTYLVQRTTTTQITEGQETLTAGDITEAQPTGTLKIVGWPL